MSEHDRLLQLYRERVAGYGELRDDWPRWCRKVLAHGGELVVPPRIPDPDLGQLLRDCTLHEPPVRSLEQEGNCHGHVAKLWIDGGIDVIGTGYALSDSLWRQHSWGIGSDGATWETKWACEQYIGMALPHGEETVRFVLNNYDGDIKDVLREGKGRAPDIIRVLRAAHERRSGEL